MHNFLFAVRQQIWRRSVRSTIRGVTDRALGTESPQRNHRRLAKGSVSAVGRSPSPLCRDLATATDVFSSSSVLLVRLRLKSFEFVDVFGAVVAARRGWFPPMALSRAIGH